MVLGKGDVPDVLELLIDSQDAADRWKAVLSIREWGGRRKKDLEGLKKVALNDPKQNLRALAQEAIKKIGG